jgi:predicted GIY-YIG superfamily endonuclease
VIELDSTKAPNHRGYLYVGQTSLEREVRVEQHRVGHRDDGKSKHSRVAHRLFVRRRPEMEPKRVYFSREEALRAESRLRRRLEARGYRVEGGTERLDMI